MWRRGHSLSAHGLQLPDLLPRRIRLGRQEHVQRPALDLRVGAGAGQLRGDVLGFELVGGAVTEIDDQSQWATEHEIAEDPAVHVACGPDLERLIALELYDDGVRVIAVELRDDGGN